MPEVFASAREAVAAYIAAAVLPAIVLLWYIYKKDKVEREPVVLLLTLLVSGVIAAAAAVLIERAGSTALDARISTDHPFYAVIRSFLVIAAVEEGIKLFALRRRSWRKKSFNYLYDAVVYSAFVSLGFAAFENVNYVFMLGLEVALPRALFSVPAHLCFSVFMGVFYGRAKRCALKKDRFGRFSNMLFSFVYPLFLHGLYDSCALMATDISTLVFVILVLLMYIAAFVIIRKTSRNTKPFASFD